MPLGNNKPFDKRQSLTPKNEEVLCFQNQQPCVSRKHDMPPHGGSSWGDARDRRERLVCALGRKILEGVLTP